MTLRDRSLAAPTLAPLDDLAGPARPGDPPVLVIGAGAAGLGAALALEGRGVPAVVVDGADAVAASWRSRYDGLRLNTPGTMSSLPGHRAGRRRHGRFPTRDAWVRYLEETARTAGLRVETGVRVERLDLADDGWRATTSSGVRRATRVVVASGADRVPVTPPWTDAAASGAEVVHTARLGSVARFAGRDVLVVGANVSGVEVATLLVGAGAGRVRLAVRTPPSIVTRTRFGISVNVTGLGLRRLPDRVVDEIAWQLWRPLVGDLAAYGLPRPRTGVATALHRDRRPPAYDDGFVAAVRRGAIEVVPAVADVDAAGVHLADGAVVRPEVVIAATGYRPGLEPLVGHLGVLDGAGWPVVHGPDQHPAAPGLHFIGFRGDLSGMLRLMRVDATAIARAAAPARWRASERRAP